jgi:hypothetical protein
MYSTGTVLQGTQRAGCGGLSIFFRRYCHRPSVLHGHSYYYRVCESFNSIYKIIQRIGPTEFSSGAGSTAGLQFRRGGNQQGQQADR